MNNRPKRIFFASVILVAIGVLLIWMKVVHDDETSLKTTRPKVQLIAPIQVERSDPEERLFLNKVSRASSVRVDASASTATSVTSIRTRLRKAKTGSLSRTRTTIAPSQVIDTSQESIPTDAIWRTVQASWYGPGFYGHGTACGQRYSEVIEGVAHKTLPCGTMVTLEYQGRVVTVPVIDRGPYVSGRVFDLSRATCEALNHCFTGAIEWRVE